MACRGPDTPAEEIRYLSDTISEQKSQVDHLTSLLCYVMDHVPDKEVKALYGSKEGKHLQKWWVEHQEKDRVRKQAEDDAERERKLLASALNKLSSAEINVLQKKGYRTS